MSKNIAVIIPRNNIYSTIDSLRIDRCDYKKYQLLEDLAKPTELQVFDPLCFDPLCEECLYPVRDYYGDPLRTVTIKQFLDTYKIRKPSDWDKGIKALLKKHNPETPILLWYT